MSYFLMGTTNPAGFAAVQEAGRSFGFSMERLEFRDGAGPEMDGTR